MSNHLQSHHHSDTLDESAWFELYRCEPPRDRSAGVLPPIRLDLITKPAVKALLALLSILFAQPRKPRRIRIEWDAAWLEVSASLIAAPLKDGRELFDFIPELNVWLDAWATSAERVPDLQPPWAKRRGIDVTSVRRIASDIANHLAISSRRVICVGDRSGRRAELNLPPKSQLLAPRPASAPEARIFVVNETQRVATFMTRSGQTVIFTFADAVGDLAGSREVNFRALRKVSIASSSHVRRLPEADEDGGE